MAAHVIILIEPRREGEPELEVSEQINQVIGPFPDGDAAEAFIVEHDLNTWPNRKWAIIPVEQPAGFANDVREALP